VEKVKKMGLDVRQFQDFTPTPGTISTAMYYSERDRDSGKKIAVAKGTIARRNQRQILEKVTHRKGRPTPLPSSRGGGAWGKPGRRK